jgi:hypothetical protein
MSRLPLMVILIVGAFALGVGVGIKGIPSLGAYRNDDRHREQVIKAVAKNILEEQERRRMLDALDGIDEVPPASVSSGSSREIRANLDNLLLRSEMKRQQMKHEQQAYQIEQQRFLLEDQRRQQEADRQQMHRLQQQMYAIRRDPWACPYGCP